MGAFIGAERASHALGMAQILFGADYMAPIPVSEMCLIHQWAAGWLRDFLCLRAPQRQC